MSKQLKISVGQYSDKGRKEINQDFHGTIIPQMPALNTKGIAIALADGISSSSVSQIAAESTIKSFLTDYYCTSDTWSVKTSAQRIISATNSWLYAQSKRSIHAYDMDKGYVCTLSAMILKSHNAYLFHIGDSRIYRLSGDSLELLTNDHQSVLSSEQSYLSRAIGMAQNVEIDYRKINLTRGDIFILTTDGVYEFVEKKLVSKIIKKNFDNLNQAAELIVKAAYDNGSDDNLTIQIILIDELPDAKADEFVGASKELPAPPLLEARMEFDGYKILRQIHANSRSHIYLALDISSGNEVALKIPSIDLRGDEDYIKRFMMEEWIAKRINNDYVLKAAPQNQKRNFIYITNEYIEGRTLAQWMIDNPNPDLEMVRSIIEQIAKGLRAFHRKEMVHQDLRPQNIMIDKNDCVKIIDFGSTKVAGVIEAAPKVADEEILGTFQYTAPEYFVGENGSRRSDFFSLGVIAYQMLTKKLPYGTQVSKIRTKKQQKKLRYIIAQNDKRAIPDWIDGALKKAVHSDPYKRYETLSEFVIDLRKPNKNFIMDSHTPLAKRNPVMFWQVISLILALIIVFLLL